MADISRITLPSGTTYDIKDAVARQMAAAGVSFAICTEASNTPKDVTWDNSGTTVTGTLVASSNTTGRFYLVPASTATKDIYAEYVTVVNGNNYSWEKIGTTDIDLSSLGALAYKDSASGNYTPEGSVSQPTFSGNNMTSTGAFTPSGSVSAPTFTGAEGNLSVSGTPSGSIEASEAGTANYTPAGTVSTPTITVTPSTVTKYVASNATGGGAVTAGTAASCTLPTLSTSVANETLTLSWTAGSFTSNTPTAVTLPSFTSQTVVSGISSAHSSQPSFTGAGVNLKFHGTTMSSSGKFTPSGSVSAPTFTGTEGSVSVTGKPTGTVTKPTFTGTQKAVTVT